MSLSAPSETAAASNPAVGHDEPLVVAYTAPWCGHCRAMLPDLHAAADRHGAPRFEVVDVSLAPDEAARRGVRGTPTLIGYCGGEEIDRLVGRAGPAAIGGFFEAVASGSDHVRSPIGAALRFGGSLVTGVLGFALDALPLIVFGAMALAISIVSEIRARRA